MKISQTYLNKLISESIKKNIQQKISESYYDQNDVDDFYAEGPNIETNSFCLNSIDTLLRARVTSLSSMRYSLVIFKSLSINLPPCLDCDAVGQAVVAY